MFFSFLISILVNCHVEAAPIFSYRTDTPQDQVAVLRRALSGIVWGCTYTILICARTSVHPNVPQNRWRGRWNRLKLMFWMIIAPELVLAWAVRQFFGAREIRDAYNKAHPDLPTIRKWTLRHGHFLQMGGFTIIDPDQKYAQQNRTVLTWDYLRKNPDTEIPHITDAEIEDRSKGDALSRIIAILQTSWFIVQCIARAQQRLALTELELVTLALASLNAVTYAIWWYKPLGMREPVRIYLKTSEGPNVKSAVQQKEDQISFGYVIREGWKDVKQVASSIPEILQNPCEGGPLAFLLLLLIGVPTLLAYVVTFPFFVLFPLGTLFLLRIVKTEPVLQHPPHRRVLIATRIVTSLQRFRYWLTSVVSKFVGDRLQKVFTGGSNLFNDFLFGWYILLPSLFLFSSLFVIFFLPLFVLVFLVSFIFTSVFGIITTASVLPGASHVPSFYAANTQSDRWCRMIVFAFIGVIFGGLHCIGWKFEFLTHSEQTLWRATSLTITVIPCIVAPIDFLLATRLRTRDLTSCGSIERITLLILDLVMTILLFTYVPARISLIAQAFALLRTQPPSALIALDWTKYLPHVLSS